jgi:hypothetical protein
MLSEFAGMTLILGDMSAAPADDANSAPAIINTVAFMPVTPTLRTWRLQP